MEATPTAAMEAFMEKVNKAYGKDGEVMTKASEMKVQKVARIPTGILAVDYCTGGGFPVGMISRVYGMEGGGKTAICLKTAGMAQGTCVQCYRSISLGHCSCDDGRGMNVLWVDAEGKYDTGWSKTLGVDQDAMWVTRVKNGEQAVDIVDEAIREKAADLIIVDSLAAIVPQKEIDDAAEDTQPGGAARLLNKAFRKWVSGQNLVEQETGRRPTVICINQIRFKIGVMYGNPETLPGGKGQDFASVLDIHIRGSKYEFDGEVPARRLTKFKIAKNQTAPAMMTGEYWFWLTETSGHLPGDTEEEKQVFDRLFKFGLIEEDNSGSRKVYTFEGEQYTTKKAILERIQGDPGLFRMQRERVLNVMLGARNGHKDDDRGEGD